MMSNNNQSRLLEAMERSKQLMKLEKNGTISKIAQRKSDSIAMSMNESEVSTASMMDTKVPKAAASNMNMGVMGENAKNLPGCILESFKKNPPVQQDDLSFLSTMATNDYVEESTSARPMNTITESVQPAYQPVTSQIDYPMIRTIMEDVVRKYMSQLSKNMLNESKGGNEINTLVMGKNFKFMTKSGDIYECTMKKIGNIKQTKQN